MRRSFPDLNKCQAGHTAHDTKVVDTVFGPFTIFDWEKYRGFDGYCTGQDDVSMTLDLYGSWEPDDWERAMQLEPGLTLDFGSHIGWYAVPLARKGHRVIAVEADRTNVELSLINSRNLRAKIEVRLGWVHDIDLHDPGKVTFIKSDVEGAEDDVIELCLPWIIRDHPALLLECSPEFDDYYPDMLRQLIALGYESSIDPDQLVSQTNVWLT